MKFVCPSCCLKLLPSCHLKHCQLGVLVCLSQQSIEPRVLGGRKWVGRHWSGRTAWNLGERAQYIGQNGWCSSYPERGSGMCGWVQRMTLREIYWSMNDWNSTTEVREQSHLAYSCVLVPTVAQAGKTNYRGGYPRFSRLSSFFSVCLPYASLGLTSAFFWTAECVAEFMMMEQYNGNTHAVVSTLYSAVPLQRL